MTLPETTRNATRNCSPDTKKDRRDPRTLLLMSGVLITMLHLVVTVGMLVMRCQNVRQQEKLNGEQVMTESSGANGVAYAEAPQTKPSAFTRPADLIDRGM